MSTRSPTPTPTLTANDAPEESASQGKSKGSAFWLSFIALIMSILLSALDLTAVSTALPTITDDLHGGDDFTWVGSAYALASTAILPLTGTLADIFGRRPIMLIAILFFSLGSALAGAAQNMNMLIAARTIQGIGGGSISSLTEIITSDLVPLAERGLYQGILGLTWAFASGVGPPIGGALAEKASWRWLFFINLPLTGVAFFLVWFFLRVRTPEGSMKEKLKRVDWSGNVIVIAGTTLAIVGLTFGGVRFPWDSAQVLAPLIIGLVLIIVFIVYEAKVPKEPSMPWDTVNNRTSLASVDILPTALMIAPFGLAAGIVVHVMGKYRPVNYVGWAITIIGFGLLSLLKYDSTTGQWVGYQILVAVGIGLLFTGTVFGVLAPLPVERNAAALAFFTFVRTFAQTWGITIGSTILQNELKKKLPADFVSQFPSGSEIAYAAIPLISALPEPLRTQVRKAFADSLRVIWQTMIGLSGAGLLSVLLMQEVTLHEVTDEKYGLRTDDKKQVSDEEKTIAVDVEQVPRRSSEVSQV
ncbi:hypothetical protein EIP86_003087 [Pleurotus ostreatoroseus]|nr:hypothetical protein EIP86_003087 [Pleurotus ostreatoroseus]